MTDPLHTVVDALARLARMLERAAAPLSLADFRVLSAIDSGEDRASRLAQRLAVGKPAISATVDSLAKRGLVGREKAEDDQRAVALALTERGAAEFGAARTRLAERVRAVTEAADDPQASIRTLAGLGGAIERYRLAREAASKPAAEAASNAAASTPASGATDANARADAEAAE
ncbi:MAG TPA: MarR family winged helix-turn-helix transcriptional regulator [Gryllotalpicola sp.]